MVECPTWKEMLIDLVAKEQFNPWDIDISSLSKSFIKEIRQMKKVDFHIPANLILAASILLRFKSEGLRFETNVEPDEEVYIEENGPVEITMLELQKRIPPKRPVTLDELMNAMEKVFRQEEKRAVKLAEKRANQNIGRPSRKFIVEVSGYDIEKEQDRTINLIKQNCDHEKLIDFTNLYLLRKDSSPVHTLLPLLYIFQKGAIDMVQDIMFNEIIIRWIGEKHGKAGNT